MFANVADKQAVAQILFYPFIIPLLQSQGTNHFFPYFLPSQIKLYPPARMGNPEHAVIFFIFKLEMHILA